MKNRIFKQFLCAVLAVSCVPVPFMLNTSAEEDFSDSGYWQSLCMNNQELSAEEISSCRAYVSFLEDDNDSKQAQIYELANSKQELNANISTYSEELKSYSSQLDSINSMVEDLSMQLDAARGRQAELEKVIAETQAQIDEDTEKVEALKQRVRSRVASEQETMRLNQYLDVLMGAKSFSDFMRIASGLEDIYEYDSRTLEELDLAIVTLNQNKSKLLQDESALNKVTTDLTQGKAALDSQQKELESSQARIKNLQTSYSTRLTQADLDIVDLQTVITANSRVADSVRQSISESLKKLAPPTPEPSSETSDPSGSQTSDWSYTPPSEPVYSSTGQNPYYGGWGNCTWGAWQLVYDTLGIALPGWGMAGAWLSYAQRDGYATGSYPAVYSIAVYVGHVAFVTEVGDGQIYIKEGNYMGNYCERGVPLDALPWTGQTCLGFIYLQ